MRGAYKEAGEPGLDDAEIFGQDGEDAHGRTGRGRNLNSLWEEKNNHYVQRDSKAKSDGNSDGNSDSNSAIAAKMYFVAWGDGVSTCKQPCRAP